MVIVKDVSISIILMDHDVVIIMAIVASSNEESALLTKVEEHVMDKIVD